VNVARSIFLIVTFSLLSRSMLAFAMRAPNFVEKLKSQLIIRFEVAETSNGLNIRVFLVLFSD
jgi:hypothetical protein